MQLSKEIIDYLRKITESREYTKAEIAKYCGVTNTQMGHIIHERREPNRVVYNKLLKFIEQAHAEQAEREKAEANVAKQLQSA
jgi:hypothetical protein